MKLFASIYIGSYETNMKIYELGKTSGLHEIDCMKMQSDIIKDIITQKSISFETIDKLSKVLSDMKRNMLSYKVDGYVVFAGPNIRQADNHLFVLEQIKLRTGLKIQVLSNSEQRFLGYEAICSLPDFDDLISESAVLIDAGSVALQITLFVKGKIVTTQHLNLGTVSVGDYIRKLSINGDSLEQTYEMMQKELDVFNTMFLKDIKPRYMILLGDQVNAVAEKMTGNGSRSYKTDEYIGFLKKINKSFIKVFGEKYDLNIENENLVEPYVMLHKTIAEIISPDYVIAPGLSVCDGMAYDYSYKKRWITRTHDFDADVVSAAWAIAKKYGSYQPHLKTLVKLSLQIFDTIQKYHGLSKRERLMMEVIAILHDCGKYISIAESASCSYTIIMSSEILGLSHKERELIATCVSLNRQTLEPYEEYSDRFTPEEYITLVKLLAILKTANALDRSHKQKLKKVSMRVREGSLLIEIEASSSIGLERGLFSKNSDFFEKVFSIRPVIKEKNELA